MKVNKFRSNVAAVIIHPLEKKVLMFRRLAEKDKKSGFLTDGGQLRWNWQFPQGGVNHGETEEEALFRELEEEIGTNDVKIIRAAEKRVRYHYPLKVKRILDLNPEWKPFRGQQQRWFLLHLNCETDKISFNHQPIEFDAFQWISPRNGLSKVVPFKRKAYRKGLRLLKIL
ncbi:MAG: RNA pyrophosphohydrolase [Deltaproteobacteria bacterium]|jgi:putative (di)nucleoside polyphosphate hydrolase|nr:RNA pyrophosphohydrolase [Deltaproteobacteria bacterium]